MLHIAVCDDDNVAVQAHKEIAESCIKQCNCRGDIKVYTASDNLLYDITADHFFFDLILLDIEMPNSGGMEIAEKIKPMLPNVKIIFITSHIEYAIDAFELSIFRYVPKHEINKRLPAAIQDAVQLILLEDGKSYTIQTNRKFLIGKFIILCVMGKMPVLRRRAEYQKYEKACSRFMKNWVQRNLFISTEAVL